MLSLLEPLQKRYIRFPKFYTANLFKAFLRSLGNSDDDFYTKRSSFHLTRIVCVCYYLQRKLKEKVSCSSQRHLLLKCFPSNIEEKKALSIAFAVNLSHQYELIEEKHIMKVLTRFLPGIKSIQGSFYSHLEKQNLSLFCYIEIEKLRGNAITSKSIALIVKRFPQEMMQSIQSLTPSLLIPRQEEAVYKTIVQLAKEVVSDLPNIKISFQSQAQDLLHFHMVIVRLKNAPLSYELLPSSVRLKMQKAVLLGSSQKEALAFLVEIDSHLFLRKNWAIDLRQARHYLVKIMEQVIGPFRDYDGGLFSQQNKQFETIKKNIGRRYENFDFVFADFFYSLHPPVMQTFLPITAAKQLLSLFSALLKEDLSEKKVIFKKKVIKNTKILLIKTSCLKNRNHFLNLLKEISDLDRPYFGYSSIEYVNNYYLCAVDLSPASSRLMEKFEESMKVTQHFHEPANEKKILRLNFYEGDPHSLSPHLADTRCRALCKALFEGLLRLNPKGVLEYAAAEKIIVSSCQTIYKFLLREHYWSNGELVTAYDFETSWKKALLSDSHCSRSELFYVIKNARKLKQGLVSVNGVKITAPNATTLIVELEYPSLHFLHLLTHPIFCPLYRGEEEPVHFNGPFIVKEWVYDQYLRLTANSFYWDRENVSIQDIFISMVKDPRTIIAMFKTEELDWIGDPFDQLALEEPFSYPQGTRVIAKKINRAHWVYLNTRSFPLQSANIRRAFSCAIDRKIITLELRNEAIPQFSPILDTGSKNRCREYDGNTLLAKQLFEQGLEELNLTRDNFPKITFHYGNGQEKIAQLICNQIESALKIKLCLQQIEWNSLFNLLETNNFQIISCFTAPFYLSSNLEFGLLSPSKWEHPKCQTLFDLASQMIDPQKRKNLLQQAEQILLEEMPVISIFRPLHKCLLNRKIKRYYIADNGDIDVMHILI